MTDRFLKKTNANKIGRYTNKKPIQKNTNNKQIHKQNKTKNKIKQTKFTLRSPSVRSNPFAVLTRTVPIVMLYSMLMVGSVIK